MTTTAPDLMANLAQSIREAVAAQKGPISGTVIRLTRREDVAEASLEDREPRFLTYAAVFVNGKWYLTGTRSRPPMTHRAFLELLATERVVDAQLATAWELAK